MSENDPAISPAMELVLAWLEAECAALKPKKRVARLRKMAEIFEAHEARQCVTSLRYPERSEAVKEARSSASAAFTMAIPRLMSAGEPG
ncbi:MAG: hypothetical protein JO303_16025 [Caulobacteraceae bacterium]|nr:hypothetical protein [Caulobacteraceae bacterium]